MTAAELYTACRRLVDLEAAPVWKGGEHDEWLGLKRQLSRVLGTGRLCEISRADELAAGWLREHPAEPTGQLSLL